MKTKYIRTGKNITDISGEIPVNEPYKSINKAKQSSRKLQLASGGLGCGILTKEEMNYERRTTKSPR